MNHKSDLCLGRKFFHVSGGLLILTGAYFVEDKKAWGEGLIVLSVLSLLFDILRLKYPRVNQWVTSWAKSIMREEENKRVSGTPYFLVGCGLSFFFFEEKLAGLSVLFLTFADPLSSLFGILYGRHRILKGKTLQGSLAGFWVCYLSTLYWGQLHSVGGASLLLFALIAGIIGPLSELCSFLIDDNFTIPVLSGLGMTIMNSYLHVF